MSKPFVLAARAVNLALIFITLDSLSFLLFLPSHQLITDQRARDQADGAADQRADCGVANGAANDRSRSSPQTAPIKPPCSRVEIGAEQARHHDAEHEYH